MTDLLAILRKHQVNFGCVNRVELDRQHLADVDLVVAVGGDGTVLSSAHFLDHGTIPLLGINSDPNLSKEDIAVKRKSDERRSYGELCMCTSRDMEEKLGDVLYGGGIVQSRTRIRCRVKSTFSETRLVPALNDLLLANPSPAAVSRFRKGFLHQVPEDKASSGLYGTVTRFGKKTYDVVNSLNVWSSGMWVSTATGSTGAMAACGGRPMNIASQDLQYFIREHMIEPQVLRNCEKDDITNMNNGMIEPNVRLHVRWNSQKGRIFIDGSHLTHNLELGDEIVIDNKAPPLQIFARGPSDSQFGIR